MERMVSTVDFQIADLSRQASEASRLLKAMSNECRLLILCFLAEAGELSVGELTARVGLSQSALSQHLARLRDEGLVATRKEAQSVFYRICDPRAEQVLGFLHQIYCPELGRESRPVRDTGDFA